MDGFGLFLRDKRKLKGLTLQQLSECVAKGYYKTIGWYPDVPQLSRWETGKAMPIAKHRPALLAIAKILKMDDSEKNDLLIKAGLSPLQSEEIDVDTILSNFGRERWRKTHFLCKVLGWDERRAANKLGIPFWDVQNDMKEAEKELERLSGKGENSQKGADLLSQTYLKNHYDKLNKLFEQLNNELRIPDLTGLCLVELKLGTSIPHRYAGIDPMIYNEEVINLAVEVSDPFLWQCLGQHLIAEFPTFLTDFSGWKMRMTSIVKGCHHVSKIVAARFTKKGWDSAKPNLDPASQDYGPGVFYHRLTKLMYSCLMAYHMPKFPLRVSDSHGLLTLVMEGPTGRAGIARGENGLLDQVEQCCLDIVSDDLIKEKVEQVLNLAKQAEDQLKPFKQNLRPVLERGTFKGTCSICSDLVGQRLSEGEPKIKEVTESLGVSWLMSRFLSCLRSPDPCRIPRVGTEQIEQNERLWVEEDPLFPELKRLLGNKFCGKFNDWKKARVQYFRKRVSFLDTVQQKAEEGSQMKTTECGEEKGLNDTFGQRIYTHILLKTKPQPLNELDKGYLKNLDATEFVIIDNALVVKGENTVLAKGEPFQLDRVSKAYWNLVADFTSASEPKQIWALWQELGITEKSLNAQAEAVYSEIVPNWFRYRGLEI